MKWDDLPKIHKKFTNEKRDPDGEMPFGDPLRSEKAKNGGQEGQTPE